MHVDLKQGSPGKAAHLGTEIYTWCDKHRSLEHTCMIMAIRANVMIHCFVTAIALYTLDPLLLSD